MLTPAAPSRRGVLAAGVVGLLTAGGLSGCTDPPPPALPPPDPDEPAVERARAAARSLRAAAAALAEREDGGARALLERIATVHAEHLRALGDPTAPATPTPTGSTPGPGAPADHLAAEREAARAALRDGRAAAPVFAVLLVRIAAARIVNADLLAAALDRRPPGALTPAPAVTSAAGADGGGTSSPIASPTTTSSSTTTPTTTPSVGVTFTVPPPTDLSRLPAPDSPLLTALDRLLAGEHAAVFAYPLVVARAGTGRRRELAEDLWAAHRVERDAITGRLLAARVRPAVAEPAYDVGEPPDTAGAAAALAARVEAGLAALATDVLAATAAGDAERRSSADTLVRQARRTAGWDGRPVAFPGRTGPDGGTGTITPTAAG